MEVKDFIKIYDEIFEIEKIAQIVKYANIAKWDEASIGSESTVDFTLPETKVADFNFTGVYHSVRFCWDNGSGMDPDNTGKIDKILYRQ